MRELINFQMDKKEFQELHTSIQNMLVVRSVKVENVDYSDDPIWQDLKKKSDKAYKELKNREYDLRHNIK
jgi:tRNA nucleotidyltransferase (CCA-adding enzyme)